MRTNLVTDGRTDGLTDGRTQATTIPEGQYWPRVTKTNKQTKTQCGSIYRQFLCHHQSVRPAYMGANVDFISMQGPIWNIPFPYFFGIESPKVLPRHLVCCSVNPDFISSDGIRGDKIFTDVILMHDDVIKWKHSTRYWPLCGEFTGHRWIPHTKASDAELWCFLWSAPEQKVG